MDILENIFHNLIMKTAKYIRHEILECMHMGERMAPSVCSSVNLDLVVYLCCLQL